MSSRISTASSRISKLPHDKRGFPVPWFVAWVDGQPIFPAMDPIKFSLALRQDRCWVCGEKLGKFKCFVVGPMCGINRLSSEPPSHVECAHFAVKNCPFLANPRMRRVPVGKHGATVKPAGIMLERNPGVTLLWITTSFRVERASDGVLLYFGEPHALEFWAQGRPATRAEVDESVRTGLPALYATLSKEADRERAEAELTRTIDAFTAHLDGHQWPEEQKRYG